MDGQEYLNQISASAKPPKVKGNKLAFLKSKLFIFIAASVVALIVIMIIGAILGSNKGSDKKYATRLLLHSDNTAELIEEYQPFVRSSELRGYSSSLKSLLDVISKDVKQYLEEKYGMKDTKNADKEIVEEAEKEKEDLGNELFEAKINGLLDMTFAHKMAYEVEMIKTEAGRLLRATKNDTLKEVLENSHNPSLENLYNNFNDFSEAK